MRIFESSINPNLVFGILPIIIHIELWAMTSNSMMGELFLLRSKLRLTLKSINNSVSRRRARWFTLLIINYWPSTSIK